MQDPPYIGVKRVHHAKCVYSFSSTCMCCFWLLRILHLNFCLSNTTGHTDCVELLCACPSSSSNLEQSMAETFVSMMLDDLTTLSALSEGHSLTLNYSDSRYFTKEFGSMSQHLPQTEIDGLNLGSCDDCSQPESSSTLSSDDDTCNLSCGLQELSLSGCSNRSMVQPGTSPHDSVLLQSLTQHSHAGVLEVASTPLSVPHHLQLLTDSQLKAELEQLGECPGPITDTTRPVYLVYLAKLQRNGKPVIQGEQNSTCIIISPS